MFIVAVSIALTAFIGYVVGEVIEPGSGYFFVVIATLYAMFSSVISYYSSHKIVLFISGAKKVEYQNNPDLHDLVDNMCIASGLQKPEIYIIEDTAMNAFATGRDPKHSILCFTSGIVQGLEKRELEGVVAHEMSHIQNYDTLVMTLIAVLVGTITLLADWFTRGFFYGGGRRSSRGNSEIGGLLFLIGIVLIILSPLIAALIRSLISRNREYLADASAALMTRYPQGLANALRKLSSDREVLEAANGATAHMYIVHPLKGQSISRLFDTHPPIEDRISRLESM